MSLPSGKRVLMKPGQTRGSKRFWPWRTRSPTTLLLQRCTASRCMPNGETDAAPYTRSASRTPSAVRRPRDLSPLTFWKLILLRSAVAIHAELFEPLPNRILASLLERLKIHDHVHVSRLLGTTSHVGGHGGTGEERDPKIERLRVELEEQAERLVKVKEEFARFHLED